MRRRERNRSGRSGENGAIATSIVDMDCRREYDDVGTEGKHYSRVDCTLGVMGYPAAFYSAMDCEFDPQMELHFFY